MSTTVTFERINSKVLIKKVVNPPIDSEKSETYLVDGTANVRTEDRLNGYIIITDKVDQSADNGILIKTADISGLTFTDAADLIEQLATNFFFRVSGLVSSEELLALVGIDTSKTIQEQLDAKTDNADFVDGALLFSKARRSPILRALQEGGSTVKAVPASVSSLFYGAQAMADGRAYQATFDIEEEMTITGVGYGMSTAGNFNGDNFNGFFLCSLSGSTISTPIAQTANDASIWKATANTYTQKAFTAPVVLAPGRYKLFGVYSTSDGSPVAVPQMLTNQGVASTVFSQLLANTDKIEGYITSAVTAVPSATLATSGITSAAISPSWLLY